MDTNELRSRAGFLSLSAKDALLEAANEIDSLREKLFHWGFYLKAHPEDVDKVASEMMGIARYERDSYGHMTRLIDG